MITISELAGYAGVTVRAVRHYHQIGLLPEPERDHSGYRSYDAAAVVRLIRVRTLAEAGVPLARVRDLLDADPDTFAAATAEIDRQLRAQIRALQEHRRRIALLGSGDSLALPMEVVDYLDRLRATGASEAIIEPERDAWILMAAQWPEKLPAIMSEKVAQLSNPKVVRLYQLIGRISEVGADEELLRQTADLMSELLEDAAARTGPAGRGHAGRGVYRPHGLVRRCFPPRRRAAARADHRARLDRMDSDRETRALRCDAHRPRVSLRSGARRRRWP